MKFSLTKLADKPMWQLSNLMGEIYSFQLMRANLFFFKDLNLKYRWISKSGVFGWTCKLSSNVQSCLFVFQNEGETSPQTSLRQKLSNICCYFISWLLNLKIAKDFIVKLLYGCNEFWTWLTRVFALLKAA